MLILDRPYVSRLLFERELERIGKVCGLLFFVLLSGR
jgi:hypothetical protein